MDKQQAAKQWPDDMGRPQEPGAATIPLMTGLCGKAREAFDSLMMT